MPKSNIWFYLVPLFIFTLPFFVSGLPQGGGESVQVPLETEPLPDAGQILAEVCANLPRETLLIKGRILSGNRMGKLKQVCYIEILMELDEEPAAILYKLNDAFGYPFEQMTISVMEGSETELEYESGNPLKPAAPPPPTSAIMDTDVSWNDLSLLFLRRTDGKTVRRENLRGRDCYIIEFPGQAGASIESSKTIWIDTQMMVLLQMEDYGPDGKLQRRLTVKNIKKISDQWMIKNMEIRTYPSLHHTLIRIDDVFVLGNTAPAD